MNSFMWKFKNSFAASMVVMPARRSSTGSRDCRPVQPFHTPFGLWNAAEPLQKNPKLFTGIGKLCISILIGRWGIFLFISKDGTAVSEELIGDTIVEQHWQAHGSIR